MNISIVDDLINEPVERIGLSLSTDPILYLTLSPQTSEVAIIDNDGEKQCQVKCKKNLGGPLELAILSKVLY